jgi:type II secretion system protein C
MNGKRKYGYALWLTISAAFVTFVLWLSGFHSAWHSKPVQAVVTVPAVSTPAVATEQRQGATVPVPLGTDSSISKVPLPLFLIGTRPGRNSREGEALIGVNKDSPQTYTAGALLTNGALLVEIYPKYVVLEKNGKSARLYLQDTQDRASATQINNLLTVGGDPEPEPVRASSSEELTDYIRPSPVYEGEVLKGYEVYPGQKSGVFARLGLQGGDVITALNDTPFADPQHAVALLQQLASGIAMTATIERKGKIERVTLDGAAILADARARQRAPGDSPVLPSVP